MPKQTVYTAKNGTKYIKLKNGINLKLAENKILDSFNNYDKFYKIMSKQELREIEVIDLRVPKQIIIKFKVQNND